MKNGERPKSLSFCQKFRRSKWFIDGIIERFDGCVLGGVFTCDSMGVLVAALGCW